MFSGNPYKGEKKCRGGSRECQSRLCNFRHGDLFKKRNESYCDWRVERETPWWKMKLPKTAGDRACKSL